MSKIPQEALTILEITESQVEEVPQISHVITKSKLVDWVDVLKGSDDPIARSFLRRMATIPVDMLPLVPVEAICVSEGISPPRLLGVLTEAAVIQTRFASELLAAASQPAVVEATVVNAQLPRGDKDRKMLHQHSGFLPVPKTQFINMPGAKIDARQQTQQTVILPPVDRDVKAMSDRFNQKFLNAPPVVDAEEEDEDES